MQADRRCVKSSNSGYIIREEAIRKVGMKVIFYEEVNTLISFPKKNIRKLLYINSRSKVSG